ncbi:hypothetical protein DL98DRAFT_623721 [Cadophora sp. DSE1049]|nr:hypothetical protein DL98DRAFT_623721 [Cadophora sp. DSE1049]
MAAVMSFPQQPSVPSFSLEDPRGSSQFKSYSPQAMPCYRKTETLPPVKTLPPDAITTIAPQCLTLSASSFTTAADQALTPPSSISAPHPIHKAQAPLIPTYEKIPTYETTGFPPTLRPMSPFQNSSALATSRPRPVFTNPLNGQRWYSDIPLLDQSQAPHFLASSPYSVPTPRLAPDTNTKMQYTSQQAPQHFMPAHPVTFPPHPITSTHPSFPSQLSPPPYEQHENVPSFTPTTPLATHIEFEEE